MTEKPTNEQEWREKCFELARLLVECRDALPAISTTSARLHNVSLSLADRIETAIEPWEVEGATTHG
jgi:hypothetical protein